MSQPIVLITGTSKGIGRYLAQHYINMGCIVIGCSRSDGNIEMQNYHHFSMDVSNENDVKKILQYIKQKYNKLDFLVNNAGVAAMNHTMLTPVNTVKKIFDINFVGTFLFCREAAKLMSKNKFGRIINFTTVAVPLNLEGEAVYAASKSAINSLTKILAYEYASYGITVNAIGPTPITTDLTKAVPESKLKQLVNKQAIKRMGQFEDVSNIIDFFLKPESNFVTGQILYLGGIS